MTGQDINLTLLLASDTELPEAEVVWGTGGWIPAREREALDWLTLARLLGWGNGIIRPGASDAGSAGPPEDSIANLLGHHQHRCVQVSCDDARHDRGVDDPHP